MGYVVSPLDGVNGLRCNMLATRHRPCRVRQALVTGCHLPFSRRRYDRAGRRRLYFRPCYTIKDDVYENGHRPATSGGRFDATSFWILQQRFIEMRWFLTSVAAVVIAIVVYAGSALVSLNGLVGAAKAGNGAEILARTDVPRLKRSLVDQIVSAYLIRTGQNRPIKPIERLIANTYGATIADALVSRMLTAENLTNILQKGSLGADGGNQIIALGNIDTSKVLQSLGRLSLVKPVELSVRLGDDEGAGAISLHFEGNGWKLSGLNLSARAVQELAMSLPEAKPRKG
jgi:hypothetical protein